MKYILLALSALFLTCADVYAAKTILVVDDSSSLRQMVTFSLRAAGYQVVEAFDGVDAFQRINQSTIPFDLVLTDINMPRMDGYQLTAKIRTLSKYNHVPIIALTTEYSVQAKSFGKNVGVNGWLVKPLDPQRLTEVIKKTIN